MSFTFLQSSHLPAEDIALTAPSGPTPRTPDQSCRHELQTTSRLARVGTGGACTRSPSSRGSCGRKNDALRANTIASIWRVLSRPAPRWPKSPPPSGERAIGFGRGTHTHGARTHTHGAPTADAPIKTAPACRRAASSRESHEESAAGSHVANDSRRRCSREVTSRWHDTTSPGHEPGYVQDPCSLCRPRQGSSAVLSPANSWRCRKYAGSAASPGTAASSGRRACWSG